MAIKIHYSVISVYQISILYALMNLVTFLPFGVPLLIHVDEGNLY